MSEPPLQIRPATAADLPAIVRMLADDPLGQRREANTVPLPASYGEAFAAIDRDPNQELVVADLDGKVVGTAQLTFIPGISRRGAWRALIEGVRIDASVRSMGLGRRMLRWAIDRATERGCRVIQLTSDKSRRDAIRFYQSLGFEATHAGLKLMLPAGSQDDRS